LSPGSFTASQWLKSAFLYLFSIGLLGGSSIIVSNYLLEAWSCS